MEAIDRCPIYGEPGVSIVSKGDGNTDMSIEQSRLQNQQQQRHQQKQHHDILKKPSSKEQEATVTSSSSSSSFSTPTHQHDDGLTLQISGKGELNVTFPAESGSRTTGEQENAGKVNMVVDTATPVVLKLPGTGGVGRVDVQCNGSINLRLATQATCPDAACKPLSAVQDEFDHVPVKDDEQCFTKTHRRNNSDYVFVSGEQISDIDTTKNSNDDIEHANTDKNIREREFSDTNCCWNNDSTISKLTSTDANFDGPDHTDHGNNKQHVPRPQNPDKRVNLTGPIRDNFTQLLREIRLVTLCDYLYQNRVIDIDTFEGLVGCRTTQDGIRQLLMTLSCMTVKKVPFVKALVDSDHRDIVSMMLPR